MMTVWWALVPVQSWEWAVLGNSSRFFNWPTLQTRSASRRRPRWLSAQRSSTLTASKEQNTQSLVLFLKVRIQQVHSLLICSVDLLGVFLQWELECTECLNHIEWDCHEDFVNFDSRHLLVDPYPQRVVEVSFVLTQNQWTLVVKQDQDHSLSHSPCHY